MRAPGMHVAPPELQQPRPLPFECPNERCAAGLVLASSVLVELPQLLEAAGREEPGVASSQEGLQRAQGAGIHSRDRQVLVGFGGGGSERALDFRVRQ
eukprot:2510570-Alexandrium_andersonii.AAC.1